MKKKDFSYDINILEKLFYDSKNYNKLSEWEFIQTIMRDKYTDNNYELSQVLDNDKLFDNFKNTTKDSTLFKKFIFEESQDFLSTLFYTIDTMKPDENKFRIMLLSYCYVVETPYLYNILANLLWILLGKTFYNDPFNSKVLYYNFSDEDINNLKTKLNIKNDREIKNLNKTSQKVELVKFLCEKTNNIELKEVLDIFYDNSLRNSFYHSSYIFNINKYVGFNNEKITEYKTKEVIKKIKTAKEFFCDLMYLIEKSRREYNKTLRIEGRNLDYENNNVIDIKTSTIVDYYIIANERLGIVSTMKSYSKDEQNEIVKCKSEESDDFTEKFLDFIANYDQIKDEE